MADPVARQESHRVTSSIPVIIGALGSPNGVSMMFSWAASNPTIWYRPEPPITPSLDTELLLRHFVEICRQTLAAIQRFASRSPGSKPPARNAIHPLRPAQPGEDQFLVKECAVR
jgi:hypothetical protein